MKKTGHVLLASASGTVVLNGKTLEFGSRGSALLVDIYRRCVGDYPKFFKMDPLSRLGFVASELLLGEEKPRKQDCEDRAVVLYNRSASLADDLLYQETIQDPGNYYPSPAVFVYTLPNIVTGEIAIRNKYYGETAFYVFEDNDEEAFMAIVEQLFQDGTTTSAICGRVECEDAETFEAELFIVEK